MHGSVVYGKVIKGALGINQKLGIEKLVPGCYFIKVISNQETTTLKYLAN